MPLKFLRVDSSFSVISPIAVYFASAAFTRSSAFAIIGSIDDYSTFRAPRFADPI